MHFFIFVLLICFFIFLFFLYFLAHDDFVLLRKDVSTEKVFNIAFIVAIAAIIGARILYIVLNPSAKFLNPLGFFLFPYYQGLSLTGGLIGGIIAFFALTQKEKMPTLRLFDFFSIAFLIPVSVGYLGNFLLSKGKIFSVHNISLVVIYFALFIVFIKFLLPRLLSGNFKDGTIGFLFLISFSFVSLIENFVDRVGGKFYLNIEDFILLFILVASIAFLIRQEKLIAKIRKRK